MFKSLILYCSMALGLGTAQSASAEVFTLHARVTMSPVVMGPSGYFAALNNGSNPIAIEVISRGDAYVLRDAVTGRYARTGFTQWNYLNFDAQGVDNHALFAMSRAGDDVQFRSLATGAYVGFNAGSGRLRAAHEQSDALAIWRLVEVGDNDGLVEIDIAGEWSLQALRNRDGDWMSPDGVRLSDWGLYFPNGNQGRVSTISGCVIEDFFVTVSGDSFRIEGIDHGRLLCGWPDGDAVNAEFRFGLDQVTRISIDAADQLQMFNDRGVLVLLLGRQ